jgi:hypothetical protein
MPKKQPTKESGSTAESLAQLVQVETEEKKELAKSAASYEQIIEELRGFEIEDDDDFQFASDTLKHIKTFYKEIEAKRKKVTDPLNQALKEFRSWYKPSLDLLSEGERILKKSIGDYSLKKEREREEQMRKIAEASQKGDFDGAHIAAQNIVETPAARGISSTRAWDYKVLDLSEVPREWLTLDHSKVKIHIKNAGKNKPEAVPGIEFYEKAGVTVRT